MEVILFPAANNGNGEATSLLQLRSATSHIDLLATGGRTGAAVLPEPRGSVYYLLQQSWSRADEATPNQALVKPNPGRPCRGGRLRVGLALSSTVPDGSRVSFHHRTRTASRSNRRPGEHFRLAFVLPRRLAGVGGSVGSKPGGPTGHQFKTRPARPPQRWCWHVRCQPVRSAVPPRTIAYLYPLSLVCPLLHLADLSSQSPPRFPATHELLAVNGWR